MASDNLNPLGKHLNKRKIDTGHSARRYSENFPMVENLRDDLDTINSFYMEFFTYKETRNSVHMNLLIRESYNPVSQFNFASLPLTITQTGISVGLEGSVGIENIWYPLVALRDLNFELSPSYTVVFEIITYGTGDFFHKIVFDGGGVDLTGSTTISATQISVQIDQANVVSPPEVKLYDAYIYGLATNFSIGGWIHYASAVVYNAWGVVYTPRMVRA